MNQEINPTPAKSAHEIILENLPLATLQDWLKRNEAKQNEVMSRYLRHGWATGEQAYRDVMAFFFWKKTMLEHAIAGKVQQVQVQVQPEQLEQQLKVA